MTTAHSPRTRGVVLLVALALVGGTGCITMSVVDRVQQQQRARQLDEARERRIQYLTVAAQAGAPTAMRALAFALMAAPAQAKGDLPRIQSLLERAAALGDVSAQVALGEMLASGSLPTGNGAPLPQGIADRPRGIALLQQAAPLACRIWVTGDPEGAAYGSRYNLDRQPALLAASFLQKAGRDDEARLWRARDILHCGGHIAAAESEAANLRRRVAESEQEFPAPTRKELP